MPDASQSTLLRKANAVAAVLHAVQAAAVLALTTDFALPVTASYMAARRARRHWTARFSSTSPRAPQSRGSWRCPRWRTSSSAPPGGIRTSRTWAASATLHDGSSTRSPRR